ncbi:hypothetical protein IFM12276_28760 [Nocardia sputorum]|uniref:Uncharacterized protein n=1 Tax=Nocardia sputorum TaxID=2984338 RepID=A0ABM8CXV7_9NOCA|nr:hypothetical protein IFM12276_28760 [Nocardia sputorum]
MRALRPFSVEATPPGHPPTSILATATARSATPSPALSPTSAKRAACRQIWDPDRCAVLAMALLDGLQTQWLYDSDVDMADHVAAETWRTRLSARSCTTVSRPRRPDRSRPANPCVIGHDAATRPR